MTTVPLPSCVPAPREDASPGAPELRELRVALRPAGAPLGLLDGAWWPHSTDLHRELPLLVAALDRIWGRISRVNVTPHYWQQPLPGRLPVARHTIELGWCTTERDPHKLLLVSYGIGRWDLLVIPPHTDAPTAARLMATAAGPAARLTASALLAAEVARTADTEPAASAVRRL